MSIVRDAAGVAANDQKVIELVGTYGVTDMGRHKVAYTKPDGSTGMTNKFVRINIEDGKWVDIGVRPPEEMDALKGKVVVATGRIIASPPKKSGPGAAPDPSPTLVDIKSIVELAPSTE
jgi:hypothetical protein